MPTYQTNQWLEVRWQKESRYYYAQIKQDLFGDWILTKVLGGYGTKRGGQRTELCKDYADALLKLGSLQKLRKQRKYN